MKKMWIVLLALLMGPLAVSANTISIRDSIDSASQVDQWTISLNAASDVIFDVQAYESCGIQKPAIPSDFFNDGSSNNKLHANFYLFNQSGTVVGKSTGFFSGESAPGSHVTRSGQNPYLRVTLAQGEYMLAVGSLTFSSADAWNGTNTDGSDWSDTDGNGNPSYNHYKVIITAATGSLTVKPLAPVAGAASNVTHTSFTAHWNTAPHASGYKLDVATDSKFLQFVSGYANRDVAASISHTLTNLSSNTQYYYRVSAYSGALESGHSNVIGVRTRTYRLPAVTTASVSGITTTGANCSGTVTDLGDPAATAYGIVWDRSPAPVISLPTKTMVGSPSTGNFSHSLTNLLAGSTYYVRAYITNAVGTVYGAERFFTTAAIPASMETLPVNEIMPDMAFAHGNITSLSAPPPIQHGFVWGTSPDPDISLSTKSALGAVSATGAFTGKISGLMPDTLYYIRAYTANTSGASYGNEVTFRTKDASAIVPAAIVTHPSSQSKSPGESVTFTATAYGTSPLSYQWKKGGNAISGATTASFFLPAVDGNDAGAYTCQVSNSAGTAASDVAVLTVLGPATVQSQPVSQMKYVEQSVSFSVTASGSSPMSYQWKRNGVNIGGATSSIYTIAGLTMDHAGNYTCAVQNSLGSDESEPALLQVLSNDVPVITGQVPNPMVTARGGAFTVMPENLVVADDNDVFPDDFTLSIAPGDNYTVDGHIVIPSETFAGDLLAVNVSVNDGNDESNVYVLQVKVSAVEPVVADIEGMPAGVINRLSYAMTVEGPGVAVYRYQIDDGAWSQAVPVDASLEFDLNAEGYHTLEVVGGDGDGRWQSQNRATFAGWTIDTTPPETVLYDYPKGTVGTTSVAVGVGGQDVRYYRYRLDEGTWSDVLPVGQPLRITGLTEGGHTLDVIGRDTAGNWASESDGGKSTAWTIDTQVPTAVLDGLPDRVTQETGASITVGKAAGAPDVDRYKYSLDGGTWQEETGLAIFLDAGSLDEGEHQLAVNAYNDTLDRWQDGGAGDSIEGATTYTWRVDLTPPEAPVILAGFAYPATTAASLAWTATENTLRSYWLYCSETAFDQASASVADQLYIDPEPGFEDCSLTYTLKGLSPGSTYYLALVSEDEAGNLSALSNVVTYTMEDSLPLITAINLTGGGSAADNTAARSLIIQGNNFAASSGNKVRFSCPPRTFEAKGESTDGSSLTALVPCGAPVGIYDVKVINANGTSHDCPLTYTVLPAEAQLPEVIQITPPVIVGTQHSPIVITGSNFAAKDSEVQSLELVDSRGRIVELDPFNVIHSARISANVPAGAVEKGVYDIRVTTSNGTNDVSAAKLTVIEPDDLSMEGLGDLKSSQGVDMSSLGSGETMAGMLPVGVRLTTEAYDSHIAFPNRAMTIMASFAPGTRIFYDDGTDPPVAYDGVIQPPRQIPITNAVAEKIDRPGHAAVFQMGGTQKLKLAKGQTIFVRIDLSLPNDAESPLIYHLAVDGSLQPAGVTGERGGYTLVPGGTMLSERRDTPEAGYTTYTMGLLLDHLSTFVVGASETDAPPSSDSPFSVGGDSESALGCFIETVMEK